MLFFLCYNHSVNYYETLLEKAEQLLKEGRKEEVRELVEEELKAPYVPQETERRLLEILQEIGPKERAVRQLSDEEIETFLFDSPEKQLLAVDALNRKNLRSCVGLCERFLQYEKGNLNAKVLLVDSLIRQEIGEEIAMNDDTASYVFIPKYLLPPEESDGFLSALRILKEVFLKDPGMLQISKELLYKETMLKLPVNLDESEGTVIAEDIIRYVSEAFGDDTYLNAYLENRDAILERTKYS